MADSCISFTQPDNLLWKESLKHDSLKLEMAKQAKAKVEQFGQTQLSEIINKTAAGKHGYYIFCRRANANRAKTILCLPGNTDFIIKSGASIEQAKKGLLK